MDRQDEYFALEKKMIEINESDFTFEEKYDARLALYKRRLELLPYIDFTKGKEVSVEVIENPYPWNIGAPLPQLIANSSGIN